jgi:peroxiredoxin
MSIRQASADHKAKAQGFLGEKFHILTDDIDRVRISGVLDQARTVGKPAPEFTLPDALGNDVSLRTLLARGPVVISFYRGEWCPFCNIELRGLQGVLAQMQDLGASLVAISPEKPDHGIVATQKNDLTFPVLSDFGNKVARQFGIVFQIGQEVKEFSINVFKNDLALRNGEDSYELPAPATFVLDREGIVRFAQVDADYMTGRVEPETVISVLETIAHPVAQ